MGLVKPGFLADALLSLIVTSNTQEADLDAAEFCMAKDKRLATEIKAIKNVYPIAAQTTLYYSDCVRGKSLREIIRTPP